MPAPVVFRLPGIQDTDPIVARFTELGFSVKAASEQPVEVVNEEVDETDSELIVAIARVFADYLKRREQEQQAEREA
jgi:hypothetical protein